MVIEGHDRSRQRAAAHLRFAAPNGDLQRQPLQSRKNRSGARRNSSLEICKKASAGILSRLNEVKIDSRLQRGEAKFVAAQRAE